RPAVSPAATRSAPAGIGGRGVVLLIAALMAGALASKLGHTINNDVAWYIYSANAFLNGARLYDDVFFDVNPPLMLYLTVPGVALARVTGLFPVHAFVLTVFAVAASSLWLGARVLSDAPAQHRRATLIVAFLALIVVPAGDFGQRSHLLVCLALPYLLLIAVRLQEGAPAPGWPLAAVVGAAAGLGFAIKPHYLLLPAALEGLLLWRTRRLLCVLRPETLSAGAVVALYAGAVLLFTPEYVTRVVPYALEVYNGAYHNGLGVVLARPETLLVPLLVLVHCRARRALASRHAALGDVFSLSAVALLAIYVMQMKGWNYHIYPATAMLVMLAGTIATAPSGVLRPVRMMVFAVGVALVTKAAVTQNRYPLMNWLMPYVRAHAVDGAIYVFSSNVWTGFPMAVYAEVEWASRFPALWLLPGVEQRRRAAAPDADMDLLEEMDRFTTESVIADLSARRPEIVFVDARPRKPWYGDIDFDFIAHFSADPRFAALWARYERIGDEQGFEVYRRRSDEIPLSLM
ncbi:MAG: hypothetical protein ACREGK_07110, partial [Geminicoccales bacterium]